jgi:hypothetical protein
MIASGKAVAAAWVSARAAIGGTVAKDAKANYGKYATLAAVMDAITPALAANKLAITQEAELDDAAVTVAATVLHESGETIEFMPLTMPYAQRTAQGVGSAITYARRYQLTAIFGLAPDDDDGQAAQPHTAPVRAATSQHTANGANAPQRAPESPTEATAQADEQDDPTLATPQMLKALHASGHRLYGDEWDAKRAELVRWATGGMAESSKQLTIEQCKILLDGISEKLRKQAQAQAAAAQAAQPDAH